MARFRKESCRRRGGGPWRADGWGRFLWAAGLILGVALVLQAKDSNPRWSFLVTNLQVFPGTERIFEPDSKLFWRLKPSLNGIRAAERLPEGVEHAFRVSTDGNGRRVTPAVRNTAKTVLFLGDSATFGIPVNDDESFPSRTQRHLEGVRAINAGVPGYSAYQGRVLLESIGEKLRPDAVVITFWPNGRTVWDHLSDLEHAELLAAEQAGEFSRHRLTRLLRRAVPGERPRLNEEEFSAEIRTLIARCRQIGARPVVQVWPAAKQMQEPDFEVERQELLRRVAADSGAVLVDLVPAFRAQREGGLFVDQVHATKRGYDLAAKALAAGLRKPLASPPDEHR